MEPIDLILKIWSIQDAHRAEVQTILQNTPSEHIGLALMQLGAASEADFARKNDAWMEAHLPELRFV